jgi:hypothetical protein
MTVKEGETVNQPEKDPAQLARYKLTVAFGLAYVTPMTVALMAPFNHFVFLLIPLAGFLIMQKLYGGWLSVPFEQHRHPDLVWYDRGYLRALADQAGFSASRLQVARAACLAVFWLGWIAWGISTW